MACSIDVSIHTQGLARWISEDFDRVQVVHTTVPMSNGVVRYTLRNTSAASMAVAINELLKRGVPFTLICDGQVSRR